MTTPRCDTAHDLLQRFIEVGHGGGDAQEPLEAETLAVLTDASTSMIGEALLAILTSPQPSRAFAALRSSGALALVWPEVDALSGIEERREESTEGTRQYKHKDVFAHTLLVLDRVVQQTDDVWVRLAALLHDIAKPVTKSFQDGAGWTFHGHPEVGARLTRQFFRRHGWPKEHLDTVRTLVLLHQRPMVLVKEGVTDSAIRRIVTEAGEHLDDLLLLCRADVTSKNPMLVRRYLANYDELAQKIRDVRDGDQLRSWQPPVTGEDIMALCDLTPGIAVGIIKSRLEDAILTGEVPNERDASIAFVLSIKDEVLDGGGSTKSHSLRKRLRSLPDNLRA